MPGGAPATQGGPAQGGLGAAVQSVRAPGDGDPGAPDDHRRHGCLLVCAVAQLVGTGFGLLLRHPVIACAATIVVPLGLWLVLGLGFLRAAQPWLTPFASVPRLLSGDMSGLAWPQWIVMALLWAGGLNALGVAELRRRAATTQP